MELTKPTKPPFVSFVSIDLSKNEKNLSSCYVQENTLKRLYSVIFANFPNFLNSLSFLIFFRGVTLDTLWIRLKMRYFKFKAEELKISIGCSSPG